MLCALVLTAALAASAAGQGAAKRPESSRGGDPPPARRIAAMVDAYAVAQAQRVLGLTAAQRDALVPRLKHLHEVRRRSTAQRNRLIGDLRRAVAPGAAVDEAGIRERLRALRDHEDGVREDLRRAYEQVDEILDLVQQARFRVLEEQLERRRLELLMRARERAAGS